MSWDNQPGLFVQKRENKMEYDIADMLIAFEQDELSDDQIVELFQKLIDNGLAWKLQGTYGRIAKTLIEIGLCTAKSTSS